MKILITGATGLIGKQLTKLLLEENHSVNYLSISKNKIESKPNFQGFYWNINSGEIDKECIKDVDVIVHLAGANIAKRWTKSYKNEIIHSRVASAELLFNLLQQNNHSVKQIISASGTAIYPESYSKMYDENSTETDSSFLANVVKEWEGSVDKFSALNIKVCKLRTGIVLDKNEGALPQMTKPIHYYVGSAIGSGKQIYSWIHSHDLVRMYYFAIQQQLSGVYNALAPISVTNAQMTKAIANTIHKPIFLPNISSFFIKMILGEMSFLVLSSKNLSADKIMNLGFEFYFNDVERALGDIYK